MTKKMSKMTDFKSFCDNRKNYKSAISNKDCSPTKWSKYFDHQEDIPVLNSKFHVYKKGNSGLLLVAIHGAGYSALTWSLFAKEISTKIECQVLAIDLRGHGCTTTENENDMALSTLASDVAEILHTIYKEINLPPVVLVGHSLGGAIAVEASNLIANVVGVCVIDVVEGTALEALSSMQEFLRYRPFRFPNLNTAIEWCVKSRQTTNLEAAKVSMPGQIINKETGQFAVDEIDEDNNSASASIEDTDGLQPRMDVIKEETEEELLSKPLKSVSSKAESWIYRWRIDLSKTEKFWNGWFDNLSQKFLDIPVAKVLILANIQGLDTKLLLGQMQGKFQLQVLSKSGHAAQEDQPDKVADIVAKFLIKQKLSISKENY